MAMFQKFKSIFLYDGLKSKEEYDSVVDEIKEQNRKNISLYSSVLSILFFLLFIVSLFATSIDQNRFSFLFIAICAAIMSALLYTLAKKRLWINTMLTYIFMTFMFAFAIYIGTVTGSNEPAVAFCVFIALAPFWTYDNALRSITYRLAVSIVFFTLAFKYKETSVVLTDTVDVLAYGIVSTVVALIYQKTVTSAYYLRKNMRAEIKEKTSQIERLSLQSISAMANSIDAKDKYTNGHSSRVAKYSKIIAEKIGMDEEMQDNIFYIALLHDVGKIGIPDQIINKPDRLTDEEYEIIKKHPVIGYDILKEIEELPGIATGARSHHERYDGKGYPDGLTGEDIPEIARIIAVADAYDAMTSNRSYRKLLEQSKVRDEIEKGKEKQFDPKFADVMLDIIDEDKNYEFHE